MKRLRPKDLSDVILVRCGDNVSERLLFNLRKHYPLPMPCSDDELVAWWEQIIQDERAGVRRDKLKKNG